MDDTWNIFGVIAIHIFPRWILHFVIVWNGYEVTAVVSSNQGNAFLLDLSSCFQSNTLSFVRCFHLNRTWHYWIACFLRASCSVVPYLNRSNSIIKIFYYKRSSFDSFQVIFSQIVSIRVVELKLWLVLAMSKLCKSTQPTNWHALVCLFIILFALRYGRGKIRQEEASPTQRKHSGSEMY